jgi:hypothetical protein
MLAISMLALGAAAMASDLEASARNFSGDYRMAGKGSGVGDSAYAGTCKIAAAGQGYDVSCFNADTRHTCACKRLAQGDTLAIFIGDALGGVARDHNSVFAGEYLVLYRARSDGVIEGTWVPAGIETLTPVR